MDTLNTYARTTEDMVHGSRDRSMRGALARFGPANAVTTVRAVLVAGVTALVGAALVGPIPVRLLVPLTAVALLLDAIDGWVARHTGTVTAFGARFDMEVDAFLILVLSLHVARFAGWWVVAIGLARYLLLGATRVWPWLAAPVPFRYWRKVVAAAQGVVLLVVASGVVPLTMARLALLGALLLLVESFGDQVWTLRCRTAPTALPHRAGTFIPELPVAVGAGATRA